MKLFHIAILFLSISTTACSAQKNALEIKSASRGNTGFRGRVMPDEMNKPNTGKDFYRLELTTKKLCTIEIVNLIVAADGGQILLHPTFERGLKKIKMTAGETFQIYVERGENLTVAKPNLTGEGLLTVKIRDKLVRFNIEKFTLILPQ